MNRITQITTTLILYCISSAALALPIGFQSLESGRVTLDENSGLQWLDVTETRARTVNNVEQELASGAGLGLEGWRYATLVEFEALVSNWFGLVFADGTAYAGSSSGTLYPHDFGATDGVIPGMADFIATFGDTLKAATGTFVNSGWTRGMLAGGPESGQRWVAHAYDGNNLSYDNNDYIQNGLGAFGVDDVISDSGSWLVRVDTNSASVPEPDILLLLAISLLLLGFFKNHRTLGDTQT